MTYNNLDNQLINLLLMVRYSRASLRSPEKGLDVSVTTVSNHINDLSGGVIEGYTPILR